MGFFLLIIVFLLILYVYRNGTGQNNSSQQSSDYLEDQFQRKYRSRRDYYNEVYLKSDDWKRKRYVVLKRDNWRCVYCGEPATQVHHKKYAKKNIGKEPIDWLVSVCKSCHEKLH